MATKGGRLDKKSLEQALEDAFNDQQGDANPGNLVIEDRTQAGGVDPSFIASLQVKLAGQGDDSMAEGSGVKAPASTRMLSPAELAQLNKDDDEEEAVVNKVTSSLGIDQIDSKLVTELNKKLSDEVAQASRNPAADRGGPSGPSADLNGELFAKLEKLDTAASGSADFTASLERRFSEDGPSSGLRAPQPTVKLSKDLLSNLDDGNDEVVDSALIVATTRGNLQNMDDNLVGELQKKLGGIQGTEADERGVVDADFLAELQQKLAGDGDDPVDNVQTGCRAPQPTVKLSQDMLANLSDDEDIPDNGAGPMDVAAGAAAALNNINGDPGVTKFGSYDEEEEQVVRGTRAPQPTQLITADMLAGLDDDEDIYVAPDPMGPGSMNAQSSAPAASSSGGPQGFDPSFADSLSRKLQGADAELPSMVTGKVSDNQSGLKAEQLALLESQDRTGMPQSQLVQMGAQPLSAGMLAGLNSNQPLMGNVNGAASYAAGPSEQQLATLNAARAALQEVAPFYSPSQDQQGLVQDALTMDSTSATKVINTMRGMPESTDMWGQPRPLTSSCKLRLAWLSKDEVRKENEQLRKEISSLRAEINMHRKEATLQSNAEWKLM